MQRLFTLCWRHLCLDCCRVSLNHLVGFVAVVQTVVHRVVDLLVLLQHLSLELVGYPQFPFLDHQFSLQILESFIEIFDVILMPFFTVVFFYLKHLSFSTVDIFFLLLQISKTGYFALFLSSQLVNIAFELVDAVSSARGLVNWKASYLW